MLIGCGSNEFEDCFSENNTDSSAINVWDEICSPPEVMLPILMFHDVRIGEGGTWSISADNFRETLVFLLDNGYTPISLEQVIDYVDGKSGIPKNPVCITFDDGYVSNYRIVLPIITELNVQVTVFVNCKTLRSCNELPVNEETTLYKMSAAELAIMEWSPLVQIQSHSYGMHGMNTSYGNSERDNALPLKTESREEFQNIFIRDCELAESSLSELGVKKHIAFSYPAGKHHKWSEEALTQRGYRITLTTEYSHVNLIRQGDNKSLFLLGRMNVNDETTEESLLKYLERGK